MNNHRRNKSPSEERVKQFGAIKPCFGEHVGSGHCKAEVANNSNKLQKTAGSNIPTKLGRPKRAGHDSNRHKTKHGTKAFTNNLKNRAMR